MNTEVLWAVAYGSESLSLKTWKSKHLQMQWLEKDDSFSLVTLRPWVLNLQTPAWKFDSQEAERCTRGCNYISFILWLNGNLAL